MSYFSRSFFPRQMTKYEKAAKAEKTIKRLTKKGAVLSPVSEFSGRIAKTFWGKAWCDNIESYRDFAYRLERGRSYVRSGAVIDLKLSAGIVEALVIGSGSRPYSVGIDIASMEKGKWDSLVKRAAGKISSLVALSQGELPDELLADFCNHDTGLFPKPAEIKFSCSCPDGAYCCKHVAAVLYGIGRRLDESPELFFTMRGIDPKNIVTEDVVDTLVSDSTSELAESDLGDVFGIELDDVEVPKPADPEPVDPKPVDPTPASQKPVKKATVRRSNAKRQDVRPTEIKGPDVKRADAPLSEDKYADAELVKSIRTRLGLSQSAFARKLGTYQVEISLVERGLKPLRANLREKIGAYAS